MSDVDSIDAAKWREFVALIQNRDNDALLQELAIRRANARLYQNCPSCLKSQLEALEK